MQIDGDESARMSKVTVPFPIDINNDSQEHLDVTILTQQATAALKESVGMLCKSCNRVKNQCGKKRNRRNDEICLPRFNFEERDVGATDDGRKIHTGAAQVTARLVPISREWTNLTPSPITFFHKEAKVLESGERVVDTGRKTIRLRARVGEGGASEGFDVQREEIFIREYRISGEDLMKNKS